MVTVIPQQPVTAEDLFAMPDDGQRYELVQGRLVCRAPTGGRQGMVTGRLDHRLRDLAEAQGLGEVCAGEPGFRLARNRDTVRAPDVAFVARQRIPAEGVPEGFWPFAPDQAVEVISPRDRFADVLAKVQDYLHAGARLVWVLHPRPAPAMVYRANGPVQLLQGHAELSGEDVLPGFRCRVQELFA